MHPLRHASGKPPHRRNHNSRAPQDRPIRLDDPGRRRRRAQSRDASPLHLQDAFEVSLHYQTTSLTATQPTDLTPQSPRHQHPTPSPHHDRQHLRHNRTLSRQNPRPLPRRPNQRLRHQLRLRALGPPLPLHALPTQHRRRHLPSLQLENSN